jgi:hypothetical protein
MQCCGSGIRDGALLISGSLIFGLKILKFFDADADPGSF